MITWLASYPKSGSTWVRLLLNAYLHGTVDLNNVQMRLDDLTAYYWQRVSHKPLNELSITDAPYLRPAALMHLIETTEAPRYVKTHSIYGECNGIPLIPDKLTHAAIYIVRDPRDIVASWANHLDEDYDTVIDHLGSDHVLHKNLGLYHILGKWPDHVRQWWKAPFQVHAERYEDIHAGPAEAFGRILDALRIERDAHRIEMAVEQCSFNVLKGREERDGFREAPPTGNRFFRQGKVGGWREELSDDQVRRVEQICGDVMKEWGYLLEFEDNGEAVKVS